jgi:hypothetical protein
MNRCKLFSKSILTQSGERAEFPPTLKWQIAAEEALKQNTDSIGWPSNCVSTADYLD